MEKNEKELELEKRLEEGIRACLRSDKFKTWLRTVGAFTNYSANNCILISLQRPDATYVASFGKWKKMNHTVRAGEKGIMIMTPRLHEYNAVCLKVDTNGNPVLDANGNQVKESVPRKYTTFAPGYVFDISQTEGDPLPSICEELKGAVPSFTDLFDRISKLATVPIIYEDITDGSLGKCSAKRIAIKKGMSELQTIKTLIHEVAHNRLGHLEERRKSIDRDQREIEAESVAYLLSSKLGLDTDDYSFEYLASWSGSDKDLKKFKESLEEIHKCTATLFSELSISEVSQSEKETA